MTEPTSNNAYTLFTVTEVAAEFKQSTRQIRRLIASGDLRVHRLGRSVRISRADLDAYLRRSRT